MFNEVPSGKGAVANLERAAVGLVKHNWSPLVDWSQWPCANDKPLDQLEYLANQNITCHLWQEFATTAFPHIRVSEAFVLFRCSYPTAKTMNLKHLQPSCGPAAVIGDGSVTFHKIRKVRYVESNGLPDREHGIDGVANQLHAGVDVGFYMHYRKF